ncbi:hypothetical protein C8Q74DRAFT_1372726 [Fomes fomentarius]|nr:hypothetical protein C8Q74DRAFT_1372726 [Fomes fomentarius]
MSWTLTWRRREPHRFSEALDTLDVAMVMKAYAITMDQSYLSSYASICFSDFQRERQVVDCYQGIVSVIRNHQQNTDNIPLSIQSDVSLAVTVDLDIGGGDLPNVQRFWEHLSQNNLYRPDSSLGHLFANGIIEDNISIARSLISWDTDGLPYGLLTDTVRQRAALSLQRVLQEQVQNTEYTSLRLCSDVLCTLISWVGASSSSAKETEDVETAHAIRALTRHGILCYLKCYSTDHGRTLSIRDNAERVIRNLHILCEKRSEDFMTPELVDALGRVYDVHKSEFSDPPWVWPEAKEDEVWILQLKRELDGSQKTEDSNITTREDAKSPPQSEGSNQAAPPDVIFCENEPYSSDASACADREQQAETHEPTIGTPPSLLGHHLHESMLSHRISYQGE